MSQRFYQHTFSNGLVLLAERMAGVQSAAMNLLVPAGASTDPEGYSGSATILSDLIFRGAGDRDARQLTDHLDTLGLQRASTVGVHHTRLSCRGLSERVLEGLATYADVVRRPHLPESGFRAARDLAIQAVEGIEDDPRQKLFVKLHEWHLPSPYGRPSMGEIDQLRSITLEVAQQDFAKRYYASEAILAVAGNIEWERLKDQVEQHFGGWKAGTPPVIKLRPPPGHYFHQAQNSEQTHIGVAWTSLPETHPDYYVMRVAIEILSGGMSGRLFTEIREKRGLVYHVSAGYSSLKDYGAIFGYAGTSNERAQETLDIFISELDRFTRGVTAEELERAKIGLKSATIMQGESVSARSGTIAHDWFMRGRIRTLDEIKSAINAITLDQLNAWVAANPPGPFTIVTVGPRELKVDAKLRGQEAESLNTEG